VSGPGASNPYLRRPAAPAASSRGPDGLADVLERVLDKGLVIAGDIQISLLDIELITIKVRLLLASADTAQQMGIDWWKHDPFLTGKDRELAQENSILRERVDQLEAAMGAKLAPGEPSPGDLVGEGAADRGAMRGQPIPTGALKPQKSRDADEPEGDAQDDDGRLGGAKEPEPAIAAELQRRQEPPVVESERIHLEPSEEGTVLEITEADDGSIEVTAEPDWDAYSKAELQDELRERGLPVAGNKPELIERLREAGDVPEGTDDAEGTDEEPSGEEPSGEEPSGEEPSGEARPEVEAERIHLEPAEEGSTLEITEADDGSIEVTAEPDWESYTKAELQDELRERGLPVAGNKPELIERLREDG
jgi:hypothetical protein